jgi:hypothetical protein
MARPVEGSIDTVAGARGAGLSSGDTLSVRTRVTCEDGRGVPASGELLMELTLLTVPACPNAAAFEERLAAAMAGYPGVVVHRREISDERAAAQAGMRGSPTLLINGADQFALPGQQPSLSCRVYRDAEGRPAPAPSAGALRQVLAAAGDDWRLARRPGAGVR